MSEWWRSCRWSSIRSILIPNTLPPSVPSFRPGWYFFLRSIRHRIIWLQYIFSLSKFIQSFRVLYRGSIYNLCTFLIKYKGCSREYLYCYIVGDLLVLASNYFNCLPVSFLQADKRMGLKRLFQ